MYQVKQQGKIVGTFFYFFDAWLHVYLERSVCTRIVGYDNEWIVCPNMVN